MLIDNTVKDFLVELASDSPAPGGGSVAALSGALGASLCSMVMRLSQSEKYASVREEAEQIMKEALKLQDFFIKSIDADTIAFNEIMASFKLPKDTEELKKIRMAAIQGATKKATLIPLSVAEHCLPLIKMTKTALVIGNPNANSDGKVAIACTHAAFYSALYNVEINLGSIKDVDFVADIETKIKAMKDELTSLKLEF